MRIVFFLLNSYSQQNKVESPNNIDMLIPYIQNILLAFDRSDNCGRSERDNLRLVVFDKYICKSRAWHHE